MAAICQMENNSQLRSKEQKEEGGNRHSKVRTAFFSLEDNFFLKDNQKKVFILVFILEFLSPKALQNVDTVLSN